MTFYTVAFAQIMSRSERSAFEARHKTKIKSVTAPDESAPSAYESFVVTIASIDDGMLRPMNDLASHPAFKSTVTTAARLPGHVILGPTYVGANRHRMVLIATSSSTTLGSGVMVAELDISNFFAVYAADHFPAGLQVRLIERDSEATEENIFLPIIGRFNPPDDVEETEIIRLVDGQARWDLNWDVTYQYLGGPPDAAAALIRIGGTALSILLFGAIGFLAFQNIRFHTQVADQTAALSQNSMIVQLTMDSIDQGFAVWNADQRLVVWSRCCNDFWLNPPKSILRVGMHLRQLLSHLAASGAFGPDANESTIDRELQRISAAGQNSEDRFVLPTGRHAHVRRFPLERGGYVAVYSDVTQHEEDTQRLNQANENLARGKEIADAASRAKSEFLATMSHEIRTPMTGVIGFADFLLEEDLPEHCRAMVHSIKGSAGNLLSIINEILDLSKLEAGKMEIENIDFHVSTLLPEIASFFQDSKNDRVSIKLDVADDFPAAINGDPIRLRQILMNLIGNAVKFTNAGRITIRAGVEQTGSKPEYLRFAVIDTGIGIPQSTVPKLFTDFTQADASITREFEGTGLGLSICKRLVELMGGKIGVDSKLGVGSTFWFTLPYIAATTEIEEYSNDAGKSSKRVATSRELKILVAEDNAVNQKIISKTLEAFGHKAEIVENGERVLQAHHDKHFDLILMDVRMPKISGIDATRMIRRMSDGKSQIPIVALTADAMAEHKKEYIEAGMDAVATKPIDRFDLAQTINEVMGEEIHALSVMKSDTMTADTDQSETGDGPETAAAVDDFLANIEALVEVSKQT